MSLGGSKIYFELSVSQTWGKAADLSPLTEVPDTQEQKQTRTPTKKGNNIMEPFIKII